MNIRNISLAGAALLALSFGVGTAAADEQDDEVRQLNIQALENARTGDTTIEAPAPTTEPDGVGGPELSEPPGPDEGMTDEEGTDEEAAPPPDSDAPETEGEPEPN